MLHHYRNASGAHAQRRLSRTFFATAAAGAVIAGGLAAGSVATAAPARAATATASTAACPAVLEIVARASTEAPGTGVIGSLADDVQGDVNATVGIEAVVYPATLQNYSSSVGQGDSAMISDLENAVSSCPGEDIILMGYSQGAQVVGDTLAGGGGTSLGDAETAPAPSADLAKVIAAIQFGDPRHQPASGSSALATIDLGTDPNAQGIFAVESNQSRAGFSAILRSWCDTGDPFCAGGDNLEAHLDYTQKYDSAANTFIEGRLSAAGIS
jgi:acetylxylan esterase